MCLAAGSVAPGWRCNPFPSIRMGAFIVVFKCFQVFKDQSSNPGMHDEERSSLGTRTMPDEVYFINQQGGRPLADTGCGFPVQEEHDEIIGLRQVRTTSGCAPRIFGSRYRPNRVNLNLCSLHHLVRKSVILKCHCFSACLLTAGSSYKPSQRSKPVAIDTVVSFSGRIRGDGARLGCG